MAEMIGGELRLPPRPDAGLGARHDPSVGDQQINAPTRRQEPFGEPGDTLEIAQIEPVDLNTVDPSPRRGSRRGAAGRHHHTGAGADQGAVVSNPMPEYPPVTTASRPVKSMPSSTSAAVVVTPNPEPTGRCAEGTVPRYGTENAATNTTRQVCIIAAENPDAFASKFACHATSRAVCCADPIGGIGRGRKGGYTVAVMLWGTGAGEAPGGGT